MINSSQSWSILINNLMFNKLKRLFSRKSTNTIKIPLLDSPSGKIVAARVEMIEKHPNADRLRIIHLDAGQKVGPVVCGAFNFKEGDMVILALPGATIAQNIHSYEHESFALGKAIIRGVESQGMICAEFELGLTKTPGDKPEIMVLRSSTIPGTILG